MKYINLLLIVSLCSSCAGLGDVWHENVSPLDYAKLFDIAMKLVSTSKPKNIEGLDMLVGPANTDKFLSWYEGTLLAIKAGKAILDGVKSRDIRVNTVINQYNNS